MDRRSFLATGLGTVVAAAASDSLAQQVAATQPIQPTAAARVSPRDVRLHVKPVMTNLIHTGVWEGPCRWKAVSVEDEAKNAEESFARWSKELRERGLGSREDVKLLEPAHITFAEAFTLKQEELAKLAPDRGTTDVFFIYPAGSSISAFEIGNRFGKPILLKGLGCRNVDIAAYTRSKGNEAFVATDDAELSKLLALLRSRKVFKGTRVLFPTDRGLPAVCSVGSIWDLQGLEKRLGVSVKIVSYKELAAEMDRVMEDTTATAKAQQTAEDLLRKADKSYIDRRHLVRSLQFYDTVKNLMDRHGCNAFTIECFEFCSSRLPDQWMVTPCLLHALFRNHQCASSCEADLGSLLAMRMLMSVSRRSCHQGNSDPKGKGTFGINHSSSSMKMNGFDQPDIPYQLGRFVSKGWGAKVVLDFMNNQERTVTVARVDPTATKVLVLKGTLLGANGWGQDLIGCSVEAVIKPPEGRSEEFMKRRLDYGNHLQWVYGDYTAEMRQLSEMLKLEVEVIS